MCGLSEDTSSWAIEKGWNSSRVFASHGYVLFFLLCVWKSSPTLLPLDHHYSIISRHELLIWRQKQGFEPAISLTESMQHQHISLSVLSHILWVWNYNKAWKFIYPILRLRIQDHDVRTSLPYATYLLLQPWEVYIASRYDVATRCPGPGVRREGGAKSPLGIKSIFLLDWPNIEQRKRKRSPYGASCYWKYGTWINIAAILSCHVVIVF